MANDKHDFKAWVADALRELGGSATLSQLNKTVWQRRGSAFVMDDELAYSWQYETKRAAEQLRKEGVVVPANESPRGVWSLRDGAAKES
jgi:hypothetical protein